MPKDNSITSVLIIGSGPIIIGQACEFDYSGTQAARSLREEGIKVILINSNPATIMTDPMMADRVYLLPLNVESIEQILQENEIDAVLPTMGGQTALNLAKEAEELGIWKQYNVRLIGVDIKAIDKAEDREQFRQWMIHLGVNVATAKTANSFLEGKEYAQEIDSHWLFDHPLHWVERAVASYMISLIWMRRSHEVCKLHLFMKYWWKRQFWVGKNLNWSFYAIVQTMYASYAR